MRWTIVNRVIFSINYSSANLASRVWHQEFLVWRHYEKDLLTASLYTYALDFPLFLTYHVLKPSEKASFRHIWIGSLNHNNMLASGNIFASSGTYFSKQRTGGAWLAIVNFNIVTSTMLAALQRYFVKCNSHFETSWCSYSPSAPIISWIIVWIVEAFEFLIFTVKRIHC